MAIGECGSSSHTGRYGFRSFHSGQSVREGEGAACGALFAGQQLSELPAMWIGLSDGECPLTDLLKVVVVAHTKAQNLKMS